MGEQYVASAQPVETSPRAIQQSSDFTFWRLAIHSGLLVLTLVSCFLTGVLLSDPPEQTFAQVIIDPEAGFLTYLGVMISLSVRDPYLASSGLAYALTLIAILLAHEMGHYIACRYYGIRATLPYFIPAPTFIGTFGAFIRIKEPITSRRALFDIGIAGPLAGFVVAIPASIVGLWIAEPAVPSASREGAIVFQDPLLFIAIQSWLGIPRFMEWNPIYFAAWVGMLATGLNLLPVGQLDGGHVVYALLGRRGHRTVAFGIFGLMCILALVSYRLHHWPGWFIYVALLGVMLRLKHPPLVDEHRSLDRRRQMIGLMGLLVFILSFMPFPIIIE